MLRLEKFTGNKTYMFPNGEIATPDKIRQQFPAVDHFPHVLELNGDVCQAVMNLNAMRQMHNIPQHFSENQAIAALQEIINTPPEYAPTPEERIAAALEFQNLLSM